MKLYRDLARANDPPLAPALADRSDREAEVIGCRAATRGGWSRAVMETNPPGILRSNLVQTGGEDLWRLRAGIRTQSRSLKASRLPRVSSNRLTVLRSGVPLHSAGAEPLISPRRGRFECSVTSSWDYTGLQQQAGGPPLWPAINFQPPRWGKERSDLVQTVAAC